MADPVVPTDSKDALYIVCLFLAQSGEPHTELGYETQIAAFDAVGAKFRVPKNTVKNERDTFDKFTDSGRNGWNKKDLAPRLKPTFDAFANVSREALCKLSLAIMNMDWKELGKQDDGALDETSENTATASTLKAKLTLPDLAECQRLSKERAAKIKIDQLCVPSPEVWEQILALYSIEMATDKAVVVGTSSMTIETDKGKLLTISSQEFPRCWAVRPYVLGILLYENKVDELAKELGFANRSSGRCKKDIFKRLPSETWETDLSLADVAAIKNTVKNKLALTEIEQKCFLKFFSDSKWSGVSKTLERVDWTVSAIVGAGGWLANASTRRGELSIALAKSDAFEELMQISGSNGQKTTSNKLSGLASKLKGGENVIFYGAPGTGKTNKVDTEIKGKKYVRTVFHPDLQNSDFFGCLKPQMNGKDVEYKFVPGPFMKAFFLALKHDDKPVYLVIEELNRAAAAAVFGDLFLLLDRKPDGTGEYDVDFPTPESEQWLEGELAKIKISVTCPEKLIIPPNLFIYATMNSADQGVYPIDTAFRRRWRHEYLPIDYTKGRDGKLAYIEDNTGIKKEMEWREFVKKLNHRLKKDDKLGIAEDRLLGQWFVKENDLDGKSIPETVLVYLWDDLLRHEDQRLVFQDKIKTYGDLAKRIERNEPILAADFLKELNTAEAPITETVTDPNKETETENDTDASS